MGGWVGALEALDMSRKRILIVGNMGYVGPVLCRHLRACWPEAELIGVDAAWFAHCLATKELPERVLDQQWFLDARDLTLEQLRGVTALIYLAAVSNDPMGASFEDITLAINRDAAARLAALARRARVRHFVYASSCSVYGFAEDGHPRTETDALDPLTAYARSKVETEQILAGSDDGQMVTTCLRFATACGRSPRLRLDLVLNDFVAAAITSGEIQVLSDGSPWRPLIDVADMARALAWAVERPIENGGSMLIVNAGSDCWNYQVRDLAQAVASHTQSHVSINQAAPPDQRSYRVDFSRFRDLAPDHQPRVDLSTSVAGLIDQVSTMNLSQDCFRSSRYVRLNVLRESVAEGRMSTALRWST